MDIDEAKQAFAVINPSFQEFCKYIESILPDQMGNCAEEWGEKQINTAFIEIQKILDTARKTKAAKFLGFQISVIERKMIEVNRKTTANQAINDQCIAAAKEILIMTFDCFYYFCLLLEQNGCNE